MAVKWFSINVYVLCVLQIEYEERKKAEGKKARDDKDVVLDMIFAAFEKHQYYNIKDLVTKTRQPVVSEGLISSLTNDRLSTIDNFNSLQMALLL